MMVRDATPEELEQSRQELVAGAAAARSTAKRRRYKRHPRIALREALDRLIVAVEWEVPPIRDGVDVQRRCDILMKCAQDAKQAVAQGMRLREDSRSEAEAKGLQPGPKDAPDAWGNIVTGSPHDRS